jgi:O-antigen ligase
MPTILFLLLYGLVFLIEKRLRLYFLLFVPMIGLVFFLFYNLIPYVQNFTVSFLNRIFEFNTFIKEVFILGSEPRMTNPYLHEFYSGFVTWKLNPFIGGGVDSFYFNCSKVVPFCNSHPHNYYLEILSELGVFGFILIIFILIKLLQILYIKKIYQVTSILNRLITPFLLLLIIEIFPLKSSGSFFTTGNTTFIFFLLAIIMGLSRLKTIDLNIKNN